MNPQPSDPTKAPRSAAPSLAVSSLQVIVRFGLRVLILAISATFAASGFARGFASLLVLGAAYCGCVAAFRREPPFGPLLTHWDEAAGYALIAGLSLALA
jgi:hypothetical protein